MGHCFHSSTGDKLPHPHRVRGAGSTHRVSTLDLWRLLGVDLQHVYGSRAA